MTGNSKPLAPSKSILQQTSSESDEQTAFFNVLKMSAPRPPAFEHRLTRGPFKGAIERREDVLDEKFINDPLYVLTRVRAFPNGGFRHPATAAQLKREGVRPGAFDVYLDAARRGLHGLRFEFKILTGAASDEQRAERIWLEREGYFAHYVFHSVEALTLLAYYLDIETNRLSGYPLTRHAVRGFDPALGHDARCGCSLKIKDLLPASLRG